MPVCPVCGDSSFDEVDGFFFCSTCHTQSQNIRTEEAEEFVITRGLVLSRQRLAKATPERIRKQAKCGRPWETVEAYTIILRKQTDALIERGVTPKIKETVLRLWELYLSLTGNAFNNGSENEFLRKVIADMIPRDRDVKPATVENPRVEAVRFKKTFKRNKKGTTRADLERRQLEETFGNEDFYEGDNPLELDEEEEEEEEDPDKYIRNTSADYRRISRISAKLLPSLCYLGLLFCHNLVTASDLCEWLTKGLVPFNNSNILPDDMKFTAFDSHMFSNATIPSANNIRKYTKKLSVFLNLTQFPNLDLRPLANKYLLQLSLPTEIQTLVGSLIWDNGHMFNMDVGKKDSLPFPEAVAIAYIVIVLKMLFCLDDDREAEISEYARRVNAACPTMRLFVWEDWVKRQRHLKLPDTLSHLPETLSDVLKIKDVSKCLSSVGEKMKKNRLSATRGRYDVFDRAEVREQLERPLKAVAKNLPTKTKLAPENQPSQTQESGLGPEEPPRLRPTDTLEFDHDVYMDDNYEAYLSEDELFQKSTVTFITQSPIFAVVLKETFCNPDSGETLTTLLDLPHGGCSPYAIYKEGAQWSESYSTCLDICSKLIACEMSDIHKWVQRLEWKIFRDAFTGKEQRQYNFQFACYMARFENSVR